MTAYERRKENSKAIASVQFKPQYPTTYSEIDNAKKLSELEKKKMRERMSELKRQNKAEWTSIDQRIEDGLWDE